MYVCMYVCMCVCVHIMYVLKSYWLVTHRYRKKESVAFLAGRAQASYGTALRVLSEVMGCGLLAMNENGVWSTELCNGCVVY